jgi:hypothetical protein
MKEILLNDSIFTKEKLKLKEEEDKLKISGS